jgi:prolyl oligopeptidase
MRKLSLAMAAVTLFACSWHAIAQGPSTAVTLPAPPPAVPSDQNDKYIWLEDANSSKALEWVKSENAKTAKVLEADPRFAALEADALKIAEDPHRLALPQLRGNEIYNFWRDKDHVHGILRKTSLKDYLAVTPTWTTVLDFDALGKAENAKWVFHGLSCLYPGDGLCMVSLSAGGEDADTLREFDLKTGKFVEGGFVLPHSKQGVDWLDKDTLLVSRDWGADTMTQSGYPFIVKEWKRGTPLDSAKEIYRGKSSDIRVGAYTLHDAQGHTLTVIDRGVTFF